MIEENSRFLQNWTKKFASAVLCQQQNVTRVTPGPETYHLFYQIFIDFFYFLGAFLSLNWDKYFALYWCFCVRISFIHLLIKRSEMDPDVEATDLG